MQLYKILSANNNLSTTERPYAATRNYYEKLKTQQELIQKHYQEKRCTKLGYTRINRRTFSQL